MTGRALAILVRPIAVIALVLITFLLGNAAFRGVEASAATRLLHLLGLTDEHRIQVLPPSSIAVFPEQTAPFVAVLNPSCSSLASLLTLCFLAWFVPRGRTGRRLGALACAIALVLAGNVLRIAGSIAVGLVSGKASLVLFHDWVGSLFAFGYTLAGFLLMLFLLLPAGTTTTPAVSEHAVTTIRTARTAHPAPGRRGAHRVSV